MKLTATLLNTLASGCVIVGVITPSAAVWYGLGQISAASLPAAAGAAMFLVLGMSLHLLARHVLGGMKG